MASPQKKKMARVERMMKTLEYPYSLDMTSTQSVATLVSWLEDRKIRAWEIEERSPLRRSRLFLRPPS